MHRLCAPGVGPRDRDAVNFRFDPAGQLVVDGGLGTRPPNRWHRPCPQLGDHALPQLGVRTDLSQVEVRQAEISRAQPIVVTGDAVPLERGVQKLRAGIGGRLRPEGGNVRARRERQHEQGRHGHQEHSLSGNQP